jgi:hypothetical protein
MQAKTPFSTYSTFTLSDGSSCWFKLITEHLHILLKIIMKRKRKKTMLSWFESFANCDLFIFTVTISMAQLWTKNRHKNWTKKKKSYLKTWTGVSTGYRKSLRIEQLPIYSWINFDIIVTQRITTRHNTGKLGKKKSVAYLLDGQMDVDNDY